MKQTTLLGIFALISYSPLHAETTVNADKVVVTASRFTESVTSQSVGVEIITADEIAASQAQSIPQLLSRYAGIYSRDNSGTADRQIDLRGFGMNGDQNTAVVLDGQRLNENELVTVKWSSIPLDSIERIEIVRGSGAVLYGGGATGGVIHIITKKPQAATNTGYAGLNYGSFNDRQLRAGFSGAGDLLGLSLQASHQNTNGYRDNSGRRQSNLEGSLALLSMPIGVELKLGIEEQFQDFPGARRVDKSTNINLLRTNRQGTATPDDWGRREGWHTSLLTSGKIGVTEWNVDLGYRQTNRKAFLKDYQFGFNTYVDTDSDVISLSPRLKIPHHLFGGEDSLVVGFDYEDWQYDSFRGADSSSPASASISASQQNRSFYVLERVSLTRSTQLSLGGRLQQVAYQADDDKNAATYAHGSKDETEHAYELGLRHTLEQGITLYGKFGRSFRIPTLDEIYSQYGGRPLFDSIVTFLKPQTSREGEIGIETSTDKGHYRASLYRIRLDNEIHCITTESLGTCNNANLPPSERRGVELAAETEVNTDLSLRANYTFADSHFLSGEFLNTSVRGNEVPLVPRHRANIGLTWRLNTATSLFIATQMVGSQRFDNDQTNTFYKKMPGYSTTDLSLQHEVGSWKITGAINNLFDREYFTYGVRGGGVRYNAYPEAERTFFISGEYRWK